MIHVERNSVRSYDMIQIVAGPEIVSSDCCKISVRAKLSLKYFFDFQSELF